MSASDGPVTNGNSAMPQQPAAAAGAPESGSEAMALMGVIGSLPDLSKQFGELRNELRARSAEHEAQTSRAAQAGWSCEQRLERMEKRMEDMELSILRIQKACGAMLQVFRAQVAGNADGSDESGEEEGSDGSGSDEESSDEEDEDEDADEEEEEESEETGAPQVGGPKSALPTLAALLASGTLPKSSTTEGSAAEASSSSSRPSASPSKKRVSSSDESRQAAARAAQAMAAANPSLLKALAVKMATGNKQVPPNGPPLWTPEWWALSDDPDALPTRPVRSASSAGSAAEALTYQMDRGSRSVKMLWKEWYYGLQADLPSVRYMESTYKSHWRRKAAERKVYQTRRVIIDEIRASMRAHGWNAQRAVERMEEMRGDQHLRSLYAALRDRAKQGAQPGHLLDAFEDASAFWKSAKPGKGTPGSAGSPADADDDQEMDDAAEDG